MIFHDIFAGWRRFTAPLCTGAEPAVAGAGGAGAAAAGTALAEELALLGAAGLGGSAAVPAAAGLGAGTALQLGAIGANLLAQEDAMRRREKINRATEAYNLERAGRGRGKLEKFIEGETPEARQAATMAAEQSAQADYDRTIGAAQALDKETVGQRSKAYDIGKVRSDAATAAEGTRLSQQLAKMRAPKRAGLDRAIRLSRTAEGIGAEQQAMNAIGAAGAADQRAVVPSPYAATLAEGLYGYGSGLNTADVMKRYRTAPAFSTR